MDLLRAAGTAESKVPSSCRTSFTTEELVTTAIPGKYPVPQVRLELDGDALEGGVSTRDDRDQEKDSCHKSGPGLVSERPWRRAQTGAGVASYKGDEVWSGDASLQQTSVLGPGDGCGSKPEGNANEIQGVVADCYKGRPGSGGSSLGSVSHLQRRERTSSTSSLPRTSTPSQHQKKPLSSQAACSPPEEATFEGQFTNAKIEMDESQCIKETPRVLAVEAAATGLGSWVSTVSWMVQDAGRLLWRSSTVLQQVREEGLKPVGARWSRHVVSLVRESNALSIVKDSQVFSLVRGSFVFSLLKDNHVFSMVKDLPLVQRIQMEITQQLPPEDAAQMIQSVHYPDTRQSPILTTTTHTFNMAGFPGDALVTLEDTQPRNKDNGGLTPKKQSTSETYVKQGDKLMTELSPVKHTNQLDVTFTPKDKNQARKKSRTEWDYKDVQIFNQTLIKFPDLFLKLQTLPLLELLDTLQPIIPTSVLTSQKIVALFWLRVANCSQPEPRPALLMLVETGLYTLTSDSGPLVLFHYLPLLQLKEVQISLAGHSLRLMGKTEQNILGVYTYSQKLTKDLCRVMLAVICPRDNRVSQHPLLHGDLMEMSLDWQGSVPDLLLDAGLRVCCQFQKSLADLVYFLYSNMDQGRVALGEVQLLLYAGVRVSISPSTCTESLAQLFLTDTHLGLVQEDAVFHPALAPCWTQFSDLILRQRSDVRCVLVHDEDERGTVTLDVILANVRGRGHPESVTKAATPLAHASNSSPQAEVWKLTFSSSSEAACLINHLSNA